MKSSVKVRFNPQKRHPDANPGEARLMASYEGHLALIMSGEFSAEDVAAELAHRDRKIERLKVRSIILKQRHLMRDMQDIAEGRS